MDFRYTSVTERSTSCKPINTPPHPAASTPLLLSKFPEIFASSASPILWVRKMSAKKSASHDPSIPVWRAARRKQRFRSFNNLFFFHWPHLLILYFFTSIKPPLCSFFILPKSIVDYKQKITKQTKVPETFYLTKCLQKFPIIVK